MTLTRFILTEQQKHAEASGDLSIILTAIGTACKSITAAVRRAGLQNLYGLQGGAANASGEDQKKLDVLSNDVRGRAVGHLLQRSAAAALSWAMGLPGAPAQPHATSASQ